MVDRVSASITIGGILSFDFLHEFFDLIADEDLSTEWDGRSFTPSQLVSGVPLTLMDHEVANGQFIPLEDFCVAHGLPFRRWSGGCASWGPQHAVFDGRGSVNYLTLTDGGVVLIDRQTIENLGSMEAIAAWFDAADRAIPPLMIATRGPEARLLFRATVDALVPSEALEDDDRAIPGCYTIALDPEANPAHPDTASFIEAAKDIFHNAVPIGNLDLFSIEVSIIGIDDATPYGARWLTVADTLLPSLPTDGEKDHG